MAGESVPKTEAACCMVKCIAADLSVIEMILEMYAADQGEGDNVYEKLSKVAEDINEVRVGLEISLRARVVTDAEYDKEFEESSDG